MPAKTVAPSYSVESSTNDAPSSDSLSDGSSIAAIASFA